MLFEFRLPDIGEGVSEGEIVEWHVTVGDQVQEDDPMVEVMTDKATVTIGAPCSGKVASLCFGAGAIANVGDVIVTIETEVRDSGPAATAVGDISSVIPGARYFDDAAAVSPPPSASPAPVDEAYFCERPLATPSTRRLARSRGVDLQRLQPSKAHGRVTKEDVLQASGSDERRPFIGVRRRIAERMRLAKDRAAHFTFVEECDVSALIETKRQYEKKRGKSLHFLPFVVQAVCIGLRKHPILNSYLDEDSNELVLRRDIHLGIATATETGLKVPVLRRADEKGVEEISDEIVRLSEGARRGTLGADELTGSTFTITSLGKQGGLFATPILNHPEVGILGVHRIQERPVVRDGEVVVGRMMWLSLSFDHRIVDGHVGAAFAYDVIAALQEPAQPIA